MEDTVTRFVSELVARLAGPLTLRLVLQPAVALLFAIRDGLHDARASQLPQRWQFAMGSPDVPKRRALEAWDAVLMVFSTAVLLDCVYQLLIFRFIYPIEAMATSLILAILPYVLARGVISRIARTWIAPPQDVPRLTRVR